MLTAIFSMAVVTGCQKEEVAAPEVELDTTSIALKDGIGAPYYPRVFRQDPSTWSWGCYERGGNCISEVTVTRTNAARFDRIWDALLTGNKNTISNTFRTESGLLSEFMTAADLAAVIAGTSDATGQANPPGTAPERFLKISSNGVLVTVYPWRNKK